MSDSDPLGGDDPFKGMPFLGDLSRMIQQQGPIAWDAARQLSHSIATGGESEPNVDPLERIRFEQLARVADLQVANATGLMPSVTGRGVNVVPVTRSQWVAATLDAYRPLFEQLAGSLGGTPVDASGRTTSGELDPFEDPMGDPTAAWLGNIMQFLSPMMMGMAAGSMVGHLSTRSFGQYDLPIPRPAGDDLLVLVPTIDEFGREWSLEPDDLRLWVCLHEVTHHAVLGVPHVRAQLERLLQDFVAGFHTDPNALENRLGDIDPTTMSDLAGIQQLFSDPEVLLGAMRSPAQDALLPRLDALVAVIVGYVDHVMDGIGATLVASYDQVTEAMRRRRVEAAESDRYVEQLFGLQLSQDRYDRGATFVDGVVERAGEAALERLWHSERELPTPAELDAPGLWLARIDLPT